MFKHGNTEAANVIYFETKASIMYMYDALLKMYEGKSWKIGKVKTMVNLKSVRHHETP